MKKPLSEDEKLALNELVQVAGGFGRITEIERLNEHQSRMASHLSDKGYVALTRKKFMVVLPP